MTKRNILMTTISLLISIVLCSCGLSESYTYSDITQTGIVSISEADISNEVTSHTIIRNKKEITTVDKDEETTPLVITTEETTTAAETTTVTTTTIITTTTTTVPITTTTTIPVTEATTTTAIITTTEYVPPATEAIEITTAAPETVQYNSSVVYVAASGNGKKYHSNPKCSNMKGTNSLTVDDAVARGYTPCKKCYG